MAEFPAMPLWTDRYLADTRHLSRAQHGAYLLLLMEAWRRPRCSLPADDAFLAQLAGCSPEEWEAERATIMRFWTLDKRSREWTQKGQQKERDFVIAQRQKQADRARSRWNKAEKTDAAAVPPLSCGNAPTPTPTPTIEEEREAKASAPKPARALRFDEFWNAYPHRDGVKRARGKVEGKYRAAVKAGVSEQALIDAVTRYRSDKRVKDGFASDPLTWCNRRGWEDEAAAPSAIADVSGLQAKTLDKMEAGFLGGRFYPVSMMDAPTTEEMIRRGCLTREAAARHHYPLAADPIRRTA